MSNNDSLSKIKYALDAVNAARDKATQGEWHPCGCRYTMISTELNSQEILDVCEVIPTDYTSDYQLEMNKQFIALAANEIKNLTSALLTACESLKAIRTFKKPGHVVIAENALADITAKLHCNNAADGEGDVK